MSNEEWLKAKKSMWSSSNQSISRVTQVSLLFPLLFAVIFSELHLRRWRTQSTFHLFPIMDTFSSLPYSHWILCLSLDQRTIQNEEHHLQVINFIFSTASRILQSLTIFIIFKPKSILGLAPPFFRKGSNLNCLEQPIIHGPGEQKEHMEYIGTCKGEGRRQ